jgi:hypothetical protein
MECKEQTGTPGTERGYYGFQSSENVSVDVASTSKSGFCMEASHSDLSGVRWAWDSENGGQQGRGSSC